MASPIQLPQVDEKAETYLLTNKGMEKKDFSKELNQQSAVGGDISVDKKRKEGGVGIVKKESNIPSPTQGASRKTYVPIGEDDKESNLGRGKRNSYKSYNQSLGESQGEGVELSYLEKRGWFRPPSSQFYRGVH